MADRSSMMVSPAAAKDAVAFGRNPVGTGPFKFVEWRSKERVVMEAFPDYWGDKPKIKQFVFRAVTEGATRSALLRTGEADIVLNIPVQDIVALKADPNVVVEIIPTLTMSIPQWSVKAGPFKDVRVRKAANLAVNRQEILQKVLGGAGVIPRSSISQGIWGAVELPPMPYDPAEAKKLLAAAGYPNGFKGTYSYVKREETLHQASIGYLKAVGIDMQAKVVEQPERLVLLAQEPEKYPGDIVEVTRTGQFISYLMERIYLCREANAPAAQRSGYCNPAVDEALNKGGTSFDQNERLKAYAEAQKLLWEDYALFWLIGLSMPIGYRKGVSGFVVLPSREVLVAGVSKS
jgi:ABC-type transport system substrate-binding protein